jgi:hypothetical protein
MFFIKLKIMTKNILFLVFLVGLSFSTKAYDVKDLLQKEADINKIKSCLILNQKWVKYPAYTDRKGWDALFSDYKEEIIRKGEKALNYEWKVVKATDYLEFDRSGSRVIMEVPFNSNNSALGDLVMAELAEGKGRFLDQIANGIWHSCEMTSWALSAHTEREQVEKTALPTYKQFIIDLTSADMGAFFAWTYYFLKDELVKVNPMVSERLRKNLQDRILDPYMNRSFWWMATNYKPGGMVNNWNPWCNSDVLECLMLLENDPDKLAEGVYRTMVSVDKFINYNHLDGACEEGPSYWGHAHGKMYDYLQLLSNLTGGKVNIFSQPMIKNMGEYIAKSYVGNGWVVNFADASAKGGGEKGMIFRFGMAVNSQVMKQFAAYLYERDNKVDDVNAGRDVFRTLENLTSHNELINTTPSTDKSTYSWYPQTEFCYMRNSTGFFFAGKGGYNAESHNHNDVGTFCLYLDETPMFIDAGVGTYTRQTFSSERYSIWTMQSNYHNLPMINGVPQSDGAQYKAKNTTFNSAASTFSVDIANAYKSEAAVSKWVRTYKLEPKGGLIIEDNFNLSALKNPNQINFLTWGNPDISTKGVVNFEVSGKKLQLSYDSKQFEPVVEPVALTDERLLNVWGKQVYRLSLNAKQKQIAGKYRFTILKQ